MKGFVLVIRCMGRVWICLLCWGGVVFWVFVRLFCLIFLG
jgi:hypothetical protein